VPVYLLDTDVPENAAWDRTLTHHLYGGDARYRLCQEVVLGIGVPIVTVAALSLALNLVLTGGFIWLVRKLLDAKST